MNEIRRQSSTSFATDLLTLVVFLSLGAASGLAFAAFVTRPSLQDFFYFKGDKFLIPRYSYWFLFSLLQLVSLAVSYLICSWRHWLLTKLKLRDLAAALTIGFATPFLRLLTPWMNSMIGIDWDIMVAPIVWLLLLSTALCLCSGNLKLFPVAVFWNLLFMVTGFAFVYLGVQLIPGANESYEFIQWSILQAMVGVSFALWFIWRQRASLQQTTQEFAPAHVITNR